MADKTLNLNVFARAKAEGFGVVAHETEKVRGGLGKLGAIAGGLFAANKVAKFFGDSIKEARESQKVNAQTAAVIKSTGGAAHVTAKQFGDLATAISKKTGIDDEQIQSSENMLATFTNVRNEVGKGNDIFSQATQVVTDMSVALGEDGKSAAIQLGKALNDPIKGITALQRVGVTFTAQQRDQIAALVKSGRTLDAQKVILAELTKEFGGSAAAQATAGDKAKVAWKNLEEQVGTALMPVLDQLETWFTNSVSWIQDNADGWKKQLTPAWDKAKEIGKKLAAAAKAVFDFLSKHPGMLKKVAIAVATAATAWQTYKTAAKIATTVQTGLNIALAANPLGAVIAVLGAAAAALVVFWNTSKKARLRIMGDLINIGQTFVDAFTVIYDGFFRPIIRTFEGIFGALGHLPGKLGAPFRAAKNALKGFDGDVQNMVNQANQHLGKMRAQLQTDQAKQQLDDLLTWLQSHARPITIQAGLNVKDYYGSAPYKPQTYTQHAGGGMLTPGWNLVGERGSEWLYSAGGQGQVYAHGAAPVEVHLHIAGSVISERELARVTERELSARLGFSVHEGAYVRPTGSQGSSAAARCAAITLCASSG
jgi:hypothetical protein